MSCQTYNEVTENQAGGATRPRAVVTPRADVHEDSESIVLLADLPGVPLADVNISLENNLLTISGSQAAANEDGYELSYAEFEPSEFHRTFRVETAIERHKITASMQHGVLRVTLPKAAPAKISKIDVAVS